MTAAKRPYCAFCGAQQNRYDSGGICGLFIEDGVWHGPPWGYHEGLAEIRRFFTEFDPQIDL